HVLTLSAQSAPALHQLAERYRRSAAAHADARWADICFTANTGRAHFPHRLAVVAESTTQGEEQLAAFCAGHAASGVIAGQEQRSGPPKVAFLFTGQGVQYIGMGRQLYESAPPFRAALDYCDEVLRAELEQPLLSVLYPEPGRLSPLDETAYTQPAL